MPDENVPGNGTIAAPEKRAGVTSLAAVIGMKTITENAAGSATAIVSGTGTETARESAKGSTDTARR